ncbi:CRISPR-associated endonuclease Cas2 [Lactiplantibacillus sp. WILCCON 0030]|uniref:CRISPR-associated endoribonuclease Cas2 n=1 Tax=Lactiplantibacillus brownii TaxID=3069269 RepID=A0ABU1A541_9LACO|nr:CRISPR-associated endonuclease Cas2 [Lactiplantibacillus brownii]MDQ7936114.1 CRISPR-associated endonuclease Cas2 [Lactiplantibacillus brownii]
MRLMVMFDLPVETSEERRSYRRFRKALIKEGFLMMQYSVYVRICPNKKTAGFIEKRITPLAPPGGKVQTMTVTEKQYQAMHYIVGEPSGDILNSAERTIII